MKSVVALAEYLEPQLLLFQSVMAKEVFKMPAIFEKITLSAENWIHSDSSNQELREKLNALFAVPNTEEQERIEMWQMLKPLKLELFEK